MAKPSDFFVGVTDLFSIILPGLALTLIAVQMEQQAGHDLLGLRQSLGEKEQYLAFFVGAYIAGHVVDLIGALVLDRVYDVTYARWKRHPRSTDTAPSGLYDPLFAEASRLASSAMPQGDRVYQWSRASIALTSATAFNEIEQKQAGSKFFRSMVIVSLLLALLPLAHIASVWRILVALGFAIAFFIRYSDLRWKAVQQTYRFFIVIQQRAEAARAERNIGEVRADKAEDKDDMFQAARVQEEPDDDEDGVGEE